MILNTFGCPTLSWSDTTDLCSRAGIEHCRVLKSSLHVHQTSFPPRILGDLRVVYLDSIEVLRRWAKLFTEDRRGNVLVLGVAENELRHWKIPVRKRVDLLDLAGSLSSSHRETVVLQDECQITQFLDTFSGESLIGNLHNAFYRIEDKTLRERQSRMVYEFLSGSRRRPPKTGIRKIEAVLSDPRTQQFIEVCKAVANEPERSEELSEQAGFDSFEVLFTLKKSGSL